MGTARSGKRNRQNQRNRRPRAGGVRLPRLWLFTDERLGGASDDDPLWRALARLPAGGGIVFRHYSWPADLRQALLARVAAIARTRRLVLVTSLVPRAALPAGVAGRHRPAGLRLPVRRGLTTASAHSALALRRAFRAGADLVFLSPLFETASHPGAAPLGAGRFRLCARQAPGPVVALGGVQPGAIRALRRLGAFGAAAVGAWAAMPAPGGCLLALQRHLP